MKLKAKTAILYRGRSYKAGDELPTDSADMVSAWLRAGTAEYAERKPYVTPEIITESEGGEESSEDGTKEQEGEDIFKKGGKKKKSTAAADPDEAEAAR